LTQDTVNLLSKGISRKLLVSPMESTCTPQADSTHVEVKTEPCAVKQEPMKCEETSGDSKLCEQETCAPEGSVGHATSIQTKPSLINKIKAKKHLRIHKRDKSSTCEICARTLSCKKSLRAHMETHTGEKLYVCGHCDKRFLGIAGLWSHIEIHIEKRPRYGCDICEGIKCNECGNKFNSTRALKKHMATHKGVQFACSLCDKTFTRKYNWALHMRAHAGNKPNLVRHINTMHEESTRFACDLCDNSFARRSNLQKHALAHGL
ncbi:Uncharacterized protein OBRU01_21197, partial [Operophtera brumata]